MHNLNHVQQQLYWIKQDLFCANFPSVNDALNDPNGLLAAGGALSTDLLLKAYQQGIFPWFNEGENILWWSPNPRCVLVPAEIKISRSLAKKLRNNPFTIRYDQAFAQVLQGCANARAETWITHEMQQAYLELFVAGYAHSVECWHGERLVGGLYGLAMGALFFGESMFSDETDASKVALVHLAKRLASKAFTLIDCQVHSAHLQSLGAKLITRAAFIQTVQQDCSLAKTNLHQIDLA